jgi:UDP-N-acetylglucosamine 4,6-dehydratase
MGSRGSVIPFFYKKKTSGVIPITDERMTRFWITLEQAVEFVISSLNRMNGGELFIPKIPSMNIMDLAKAIAPDAKIEIIGIRPGEKIHEVMISSDDAINTIEFDSHFVIQPSQPWWDDVKYNEINGGKKVKAGFKYSSDINDQWLSSETLKKILDEFDQK